MDRDLLSVSFRCGMFRESLLRLTGIAGLWLAAAASGNEWHVDGRAGAGNGTERLPFATIQQAVEVASAGDTIVVHEGVYREAVELRRGGTPEKPISFVTRGEVVVDGADPFNSTQFEDVSTNEERSRGVTVWTAPYKARFFYTPGGNELNDRNRQAWEQLGQTGIEQVQRFSRSDMIWLNGGIASEVRRREELKPRTFLVDVESGVLMLALPEFSRPEHFKIETTVRSVLFSGEFDHISISGFRFSRGGTHWDAGAMTMGLKSIGWVVSDNWFVWNNWCGLHVRGEGHRILRNVSNYNGGIGFSGAYLNDTIFDGNSTGYNNWKNHRWEFQAGGMKLAWARNVTIRNHRSESNVGPGIWMDIDNENVLIENCRASHNTYAGIFFEFSSGPAVIKNNFAYANDGAGILIAEAANVTVTGNLCLSNKWGISVRDMPRERTTQNLSVSDNLLVDNGAGIHGPLQFFIQAQSRKFASNENTFWNNPALAAYANLKTLSFGAFVTPSERGVATFELAAVKREFRLERNSIVRDPNFDPVLRATYEIEWPLP